MPTATYQIDISATSGLYSAVTMQPGTVMWSSIPERASRAIAPVCEPSQAYYWKYAWQRDEREALDELAAGQGRVFENADEAIRYLLSTDD
jgi:hypothetical protein